MRKSILSAMAILACVCILALGMPGTVSAEKRVDKVSYRFVVETNLLAISAFPFFSPIYDTQKDTTLPEFNKDTRNKVKITEGVVRTKPPDEDGD